MANESITAKQAWVAYAQVHEHIQCVGMVHADTDVALKLLENFIRQELEK